MAVPVFFAIDARYTIVPLKLNFASQKKGAWPSRPCRDWSTFSHYPAHRNTGADRSTQAGPNCAPLLKYKSKRLFGYNTIVTLK